MLEIGSARDASSNPFCPKPNAWSKDCKRGNATVKGAITLFLVRITAVTAFVSPSFRAFWSFSTRKLVWLRLHLTATQQDVDYISLKEATSTYLLSFWKAKTFFASVEFQRETVSCRVLQWMARTDMDWKFEFGPTFSSFNARPAKVTPKIIMVSASWWWSLFDIFFITLTEHFVYGKGH